MILNIDSSSVVKFTDKLEGIRKKSIPYAVRNALNKTALDVKQNTMPKSADKTFTVRQSNFFKANSQVGFAKGTDLRQMKAVVGFTENRLKGGNNYAVKDLEQQEHGGTIKSRTFIPTKEARGGSNTRTVRPSMRLSKIKNKVVSPGRGKQGFVKSALKAGRGGYVLTTNRNMLLKVGVIKKTGGRTKINTTGIYSVDRGRSVKVSPTGFMKEASFQSSKRMENFYITEVKRQLARIK